MSNSADFIYDARRGGVFSESHNVAPGPGFSWRRAALLDCVKKTIEFRPERGSTKSYMEIGFGSGVLAYEFYLMGFEVTGYDFSKKAVETADSIFNQDNKIMDFRNQLDEEDIEKYDCLGAFEVLEHIEDDSSIINEWRTLIKDGGFLALSVPLKMKYWNYSDLRAGHVRRYEKNEIISLLENNGFDVMRFSTWSFPFGNLIRMGRNRLIDKPVYEKMQTQDKIELTKISGIERSQESKYAKYFPFKLFQMLGKINKLFYRFNFGEGCIIIAKKC